VAIEVSETTWNLLGIALLMLHFQANLLFPYVSTEHSAKATGRHTLRGFRVWWQLLVWADGQQYCCWVAC